LGEIAAELAMHLEQARDPARAVKYLLQAVRLSVRISHEAAAGDCEFHDHLNPSGQPSKVDCLASE